MSWGTIVVGVDASGAGADAAAAGWALAQKTGSPCHLVHAVREVWPVGGGAVTNEEHAKLMADVMRLSRESVNHMLAPVVPAELLAEMEVAVGSPAKVLQEVARDRDAGLVVLGAKRHGLVARWLGGSTAKNAVRAIERSVLISTGARPIRRVLAAVDLSELALPTLRTAERFARLHDARLRVLHTIEPFPFAAEGLMVLNGADLEREAEQLFDEKIWQHVQYPGAERVVARGPAHAMIDTEAVEWGADLVVVGAHGRGRMERALLGSVSESVVNSLPASVLVVRA